MADKHSIPVHVDGARILNAAVALNVTPKDLMDYADSVSFCFSKVKPEANCLDLSSK